MDILLVRMIKNQVFKAITLCIAGMVLFAAEMWIGSREIAMQQVTSILVLATLFFAFGLLSASIYIKVMRGGGKWAMQYYMLAKSLRFFLALIILIVYALLIQTNLAVFAINLFVIYLIDIAYSTALSIRIEQQTKNKK